MIFFAVLAGILALVFSGALFAYIAKQDTGSPRMQELYLEIKHGSRTYLKRQYKAVILISLAIGILLYLLFDYKGLPFTSAAFVLGALCSLLASYIGMETSTHANVRAAQAAISSTSKMFKIAFSGGIVMGLANVGLSLIGISGLYIIYGSPIAIVSFGFGASLSALFALLGGGIFTKAADIGADLVGKIEKNIPEDDARNPAVIADNVGDNVGDIAGRGADLFESCTGENIAAMILGVSIYAITQNLFFIIFPLLAKAIGIFSTILGMLFVRARENQNPMIPLRNGLVATSIFCAFGFCEIESVVVELDGVLEAAAIGMPDEKSGEAVKLYVVRKDDSVTSESILEHCRKHLTAYKVPREVEFRDELPKTNVGKILRRALRDE